MSTRREIQFNRRTADYSQWGTWFRSVRLSLLALIGAGVANLMAVGFYARSHSDSRGGGISPSEVAEPLIYVLTRAMAAGFVLMVALAVFWWAGPRVSGTIRRYAADGRTMRRSLAFAPVVWMELVTVAYFLWALARLGD